MDTAVRKIDRDNIDGTVIREAGEILRNGGLVAFPTETVYGLGANALDEQAAKKTYAAKGRPSDNPLIVHIADMEALAGVAAEIPEKAVKAAARFWPGPLTMIFPKKECVPYSTTGGLDTVAVRMPEDEIAREIIRAGGGYISAPSANTSGRPSPTAAGHVLEDLDGRIEMLVDGGPVEIGVESSILDMTVSPPMLLRPGAVTREMLEQTIGEVAVDRASLRPDGRMRPKAPGMAYRHYAPRAELTVVEGPPEAAAAYMNRQAREQMEQGRRVGILATAERLGLYHAGEVKCIGTRADGRTVAARLFGALREFDAAGMDRIYSEAMDEDGIGSAVMDRLRKAAGFQVIRIGGKDMESKREGYISWDEYFMGIAILSAHRSKDPNTQVGCCIVSQDNKILSMGYNGFPTGCSDDEFPWAREGEDELGTKYFYTVHSELNAILNYRGGSLEGAKLYVSLFPCNECAKAIIQSGIKEVIYDSNKYENTSRVQASARMFDAAGVSCRQYRRTGRTITIGL